MRRLLTLLFILGLMAASFPLSPVSLAAPGDISVVSSSYDNKFPKQLVFHLEAKSSAEIKKVTLYYETVGGNAASSAPATITPGTPASAQYTLDLARMRIPPTTEIRYRWLIEDAAGNSLRTEFTTFSLDDVRFNWNKQAGEGITVYWYQGSKASADDLLTTATAAVKRISADVGITFTRPIRIVVYDSKADMAPVVGDKGDTWDREITTLGAMLSPDVLVVLGNQRDVKATLAHELTHMIVHQMVDNPYGSIPQWLDEGLAMAGEGDEALSDYKKALQDGIRRNDVFSVRSMASYSGDTQKIILYYGESYSLVRFLIDTYGQDKLIQLLKVFKEGTPTDAAIRTVYGLSMDEFDAGWRASVGLAPRTGNNSTAPTSSTPVPTLVPFGLPNQTSTSGLVTLVASAGVAVGLCTGALVFGVGGFFLVRRVRR